MTDDGLGEALAEIGKRRGRLLVVGCEHDAVAADLAAAGVDVTLLDESETLLCASRERHSALHERVVRADVLDWRPPRRFDLVLARADYVAPRDREAFRAHALERILFPDGALLLLDGGLAILTPEDR